MLGKDVGTVVQRPVAARPDDAITVDRAVRPERGWLDFEIAAGEVVGLTGLPGSGFESLPYLLAGAAPATAGWLRTPSGEIDLARAGVRGCIRAGIALVPERRDRDGLAMSLSVRDNVSLPTLHAQRQPLVRRAQVAARVDAAQAIDDSRHPSQRADAAGERAQRRQPAEGAAGQVDVARTAVADPARADPGGRRRRPPGPAQRDPSRGRQRGRRAPGQRRGVRPGRGLRPDPRLLTHADRLQEIRTDDPDIVLDTVYAARPSGSLRQCLMKGVR